MRLRSLYRERFAQTNRADGGGGARNFRPAVHRGLSRAVPVQPPRAASSAGRVRFVASSSGVTVTDLDGNVFYDLTGSYGVNLFGHDFYKACIERGAERVRTSARCSDRYHPVVADNVARLRAISGLDEVSFHMSGTEAVMQAVRLARYHTGRSHLVRFCGAYHGWWGDVQPGIGNPSPAHDTYTLAEMSGADAACPAPSARHRLRAGQSAAGAAPECRARRRTPRWSTARGGPASTATPIQSWLQHCARSATNAGIVLIFDEVFVGFRLAPGGAAEYFGVQPDLVTYGKTLGGGLPVGVLCGRARSDEALPHRSPGRMSASPAGRSTPIPMSWARWRNSCTASRRRRSATCTRISTGSGTAARTHLNRRLLEADLPVKVANLSSIWTVCYTRPSRYNWMLQYYLRAEGLALSWVGTGRLIFSLNYTEADFAAVADRFLVGMPGDANATAGGGRRKRPPQTARSGAGSVREILTPRRAARRLSPAAASPESGNTA